MSNIIFFKKRTVRDESQLLKEETNRFFMEKNLINGFINPSFLNCFEFLIMIRVGTSKVL